MKIKKQKTESVVGEKIILKREDGGVSRLSDSALIGVAKDVAAELYASFSVVQGIINGQKALFQRCVGAATQVNSNGRISFNQDCMGFVTPYLFEGYNGCFFNLGEIQKFKEAVSNL